MTGLGTESAVVVALIVVVSVAMLARRISLPYTIALVVIGLLLGILPLVPQIELTPNLILLVFLPPLLFEASFNLDVNQIRRNLSSILLLAIPGVVLGAFMIAGLISLTLDRPFKTALVFGALIAATDPVSVLAIFSRLGAPERLTTIVEGESLFNDGVAIVLYGIVLNAALGGDVSVAQGVADFIKVGAGGALAGFMVGLLAAAILRQVDDHLIEITITSAVAFGAFVVAEQVHVSGVIAVVVAGLLVGTLRTGAMSPTTRVALESFWEYVGFLLNSMIFLLMGMRIAAPHLLENLNSLAVVFLVVLVARIVIVLVVNLGLRLIGDAMPWRWTPILIWGGLRGAVSLAIALSLPLALPDREWVQLMAFGVVLITLVGQGLTMPPLLRLLGFGQRAPLDYEQHVAKLQGYSRAMQAIERERVSGNLLPEVAASLRKEYEDRIFDEHNAIAELGLTQGHLRQQQRRRAERQALMAQRDTYRRLRRQGHVTAGTFQSLISDVDARLVELEDEGGEGTRQ
jgi:CPA1 family monovalent cation:H+ antiporter